MSSNYRLICLSHDPAIVVTNDGDAPRSLEAALEARTHDTQHTHCDVIIGEYSYPLVSAYCIGSRNHTHREPAGINVKWLRLLLAASVAPTNPGLTAAIAAFTGYGCWTPERVHLLRLELGVSEAVG